MADLSLKVNNRKKTCNDNIAGNGRAFTQGKQS